MRDPDLFGRIDRVLHECDARQLPPLTAAFDGAGTAEHVVVTETATGRIVYPPVVSIDEGKAAAARWLGFEPAELGITEPRPRRRIRWPWRRV